MLPRRTVASVHNDWLTLVEPVGAFLTIPVLKRVFPNGIAPVDRDVRADVRQRLDEMTTDVGARTAWLQWIARDLLSLGPRLREASAMPAGLSHTVAERHTTLRPDFVIVEPQKDGQDRARLLGIRWPLRTPLDRRPTTDERGQPTAWAATPIERAALLCRAVNVPLALVTDTDRFALVWAPVSGPSGHAIWTSSLFSEERLLLDSFVAVLGAQRFFGVAEKETLEALLTESGSAQAEVTGKLGEQVRKAVELLVDAFSRADRAAGGRILAAVQPAHVYNAAVTVMMRLVVLLAAEERRLLPADDPIYSASYSILTTRDQLERDAMRDGIETLEKRHAAWHRLLATFRAVHAGIEHDRLRLPAYGGSLFDPTRYPFLDAPPIPVDDRAMLAVLDALQVLSFRQGSVTEARRISYLNLDVEQIGHVYEGLLDHGCARVDAVVLGLIGSKGEEPEIALSELERELRRGEDSFAEWVAEKGGPQTSRIKKLLFEDLDPDQDHRLLAACDNDQATYDRVRPFGGLLRKDLRELPAVFMPGSLYVTQVSLRRDSGTAYTTKELADEVVQYALEPLVYSPGPAEGAEPADWKLKSSAELLRLKVCDPAVGSGAILVAACRYLADRLVEAWKAETSAGSPPAILGGVHESEWTLVARRSVTDHCLYGVDRNPMALEMAKLSLWLTTMAKERPFTFLDHQVRSGDSLLGIASLDQVRWVHIDPERGTKLWKDKPLFTDPRKVVDARVTDALDKARALAAIDVISLGDVDRKERLHSEMVEALAPLGVLANAVIGAALAEAGGEGKVDALLQSIANCVEEAFSDNEASDTRQRSLAEVRDQAQFWLDTDHPDLALDRRCLHWPLTFPEVFLAPNRSGFDAIVGNPPFVGGQLITGSQGAAYRDYLVEVVAKGRRGSADLVSYFFLRLFALLQKPGGFGLLATKTIAQGDTREVGLDSIVNEGGTITRAVPTQKWPGVNSLEIAKVWMWRGTWSGKVVLSGSDVTEITSYLDARRSKNEITHRLRAALVAPDSTIEPTVAWKGSELGGDYFLLTLDEAGQLAQHWPEASPYLRPFLNGEDILQHLEPRHSRFVIYFGDMEEERIQGIAPGLLELLKKRLPENHRTDWWRLRRPAVGLYKALVTLKETIVIPETSAYWAVDVVSTGPVFSKSTIVVPTASVGVFAVMQSSIHESWKLKFGPTFKLDPRYAITDCFETFPFPEPHAVTALDQVGTRYLQERADLGDMTREPLTRLYSRLHNSEQRAPLVQRLRDTHQLLDNSVREVLGWNDVDLEHGFYTTRQGIRFTISTKARQEILDRLLELNHQRYAEEVAQGLHEKAMSKNKMGATPKKGRRTPTAAPLLEGV